MHIVSVIVFYAITATVLIALLMIIKLDAKKKARKKCMMNHPAGKLAPIEPSLFGETEENFRKRYQGGFQSTDLKGD